MQRMSYAVVSSGTRSCRRCFSTSSRLYYAAEVSSSSSSQHNQDEDESRKPFYQNSKAASRPRPNTRSPLYTASLLPKLQDGDFRRRKTQPVDNSLQAPYIAALNSPPARLDENLHQLYMRLDAGDRPRTPTDCIRMCADIKSRLQRLSTNGKTIQPPVYVYQILLKSLAEHGAYELCLQVVADMEACGLEVDITIMNLVLRAAISMGEEQQIEETLVKIASLHGDYNLAEPSSVNSRKTLLPKEWTKNWNPTTYQLLLRRCRFSHNVDFSFALLGSASLRQKEGGDGLSFLTDVMDHNSVVDLIYLLSHAREARLLVEVAHWLENGVAARKLQAQSWMTVLRCCADQAYLPGIKIAWEYTVNKGLMTPDDGIIILILNAASRAGDTEFIKIILDYHRERLKQANLSLQEWHYMPLFDSHCINRDYIQALETANFINKTTGKNLKRISLWPLRIAACTSMEDMKAAFEAFLHVGRDPSEKGGISVEILNTLLNASNRLGKFGMSMKLYRSRNVVRNDTSPPDCPLPPLPNSIQDDELNDINLLEEEQQAEVNDSRPATTLAKEPSNQKDKFQSDLIDEDKHLLKADIETYNELLYAAVMVCKPKVGQVFFRHLNQAKLKADERTYELAIRLQLIHTDYSDSFRLLEECKKRGMKPNRWSYLLLAVRCLQEGDPRWVGLGLEMLELDYGLGHKLYYAMVEGGHLTADTEYAMRHQRSRKRSDQYSL